MPRETETIKLLKTLLGLYRPRVMKSSGLLRLLS